MEQLTFLEKSTILALLNREIKTSRELLKNAEQEEAEAINKYNIPKQLEARKLADIHKNDIKKYKIIYNKIVGA